MCDRLRRIEISFSSMNTTRAGKIRVLYIVSRLQRHGPIFQLYNLVRYLDRQRFCPRIITLSPEARGSLLTDFEKIDVECRSLGLSRVAGMILGPGRIKRLLKERAVDLVHVFDYRSTLLCASHITGVPRVVTCRQSYRPIFGPVLGSIMTTTFLRACGKCERVVAVSNSIRNLVENEVGGRIDVIHNGIDVDRFRPVDQDRKRQLRSRLGLPPNKRIFLSVGFLTKAKGVPTLIEAFLKGADRQSDVLVLLGDGPLREKCSRLTDGRDNIRMAGSVENVEDYLGAADVFVSASLTEGCPNAVMEAMACGLSVVLSDIPAHREILALDERAGLVFTTQDAASLSAALAGSRDMNYSEQSSAALGIVRNHLNARSMSLKYQTLYAELCR